MKTLIIRGGHIITPLEERFADLWIEGHLIKGIFPAGTKIPQGARVIDATHCWVTPGLFDLQVNGGPECDFWGDPSVTEVAKLARRLANAGVTSILPTLITGNLGHMKENLQFLANDLRVGADQVDRTRNFRELERQPAVARKGKKPASSVDESIPVRMPGVHLEGPCLSPERPGVHPKEHLQPLSIDVLQEICTPIVKFVTLAPELDAKGATIKWLLDRKIEVALGHSNATYEEADKAFENGVRFVTHLFNAMPAIHHRAPGAVTSALLDNRVSCCIICDGLHLAPPTVALILRAKTANKTILVTDMGHIGTSKGGLVGSSILLSEAVKNVVRWGVASFMEAIRMASYNPAHALGLSDAIGHLDAGKHADVIVWDKTNHEIRHVLVAGEKVDR